MNADESVVVLMPNVNASLRDVRIAFVVIYSGVNSKRRRKKNAKM